ncbi:MAG: DUF2156 domain-containing protein [Treponema sp.]|nr:DUF2156 domain-containing protein [Treponema sp.]
MGCPTWREPTPHDKDLLFKAANENAVMACTDSYANVILYRKKYETLVCSCGGLVLRKYHRLEKTDRDIAENHILYGFPLGTGDIRAAIDFLTHDAAAEGIPLAFPLLSAEQKLFLERKMPNHYTFTERRDDSDYLYLTKNLADLPGGKYHKKKNHISQFKRKYPEAEYRPITVENADDARRIEDEWYAANDGDADRDKRFEKEIIDEALALFDVLNLTGGILYVAGRPVAMTMGSPITEQVADVHFEKAVPGFDRDGAFAVINQLYAKTMTQYEYLNREEDLGIEGLRKAKLSYHPDILLAKWIAA